MINKGAPIPKLQRIRLTVAFQRISQLIIRVDNGHLTLLTVTGRNIILATAMRALLEAKAVIALLQAPVLRLRFTRFRRLQQPLTPAPVVFDQ